MDDAVMARYVFIRHGESVWNGERRIQGNQDPPLSPRGRQQAARLAASVSFHLRTAAAIYTSPLRRAAETAEALGAATGLPVLPEPGLQEMRLGRWEGMRVPEIQAAFPGSYERWLADPLTHPAPDGERLEEFVRRVVDAWTRLCAAHPEHDLVLVSHGGPIKAIVCHVLGVPPRRLFRIKQDNTAVSVVEADATSARVVLLNDTCHLAEASADLVARDVLTDAGEAGDTIV
jgi:broad specificity phosphatase PhoE